VVKWNQSGTPGDSQPLDTIFLKRVWARDFGLNDGIFFDFGFKKAIDEPIKYVT
jgi:hypothetical protein